MSNIQPEVLKTIRSKALGEVNKGNKRTHAFYAEFTDINPKFTKGKFVVHHPTQLERMQIGVNKTLLLGGVQPLDNLTDNLSHIMATLDVVLDEQPSWFNVEDPDVDYDVLEAVFVEYMEWVNSFRRKPSPDQPQAGSEDGRSEVPVVANEGVQVSTDGGQVSQPD